jgi:hypothetical protein
VDTCGERIKLDLESELPVVDPAFMFTHSPKMRSRNSEGTRAKEEGPGLLRPSPVPLAVSAGDRIA